MTGRIDPKKAAIGALIGGAVAGLINTGIYFIGSALGADYKPKEPIPMGDVLPAYMPFVSSFASAVVATIVAVILAKVAKDKAWPIFAVISVIVFVFEGYNSVASFSDMNTIIALELMHIPGTIGIVGGIYRARIPG